MTKEKIHFVITGGTIDSFYDGRKDTAVPNEKSIIPEYIESLQLDCQTEFTEICKKDSRDMTEEDLKKLLESVQNSGNKKILITHGTYTLSDTARYLKANLTRDDQTIVLTGSLIPIKGFSPSDGPFNLGFAIAKLESLGPGVYVCMNGRVFEPEEIAKLISEGRFISIFSKQR